MLFTDNLRKNDDFRHVYKEGRSVSDRFIVVYMRSNGTDKNRIGVSVSKKVGNSVVRHRIKRLVRENYRLEESCFKRGFDIVVIARNLAADADFYDIGRSFMKLSGRLSLVENTV